VEPFDIRAIVTSSLLKRGRHQTAAQLRSLLLPLYPVRTADFANCVPLLFVSLPLSRKGRTLRFNPRFPA